jgi:hypothetical protein
MGTRVRARATLPDASRGSSSGNGSAPTTLSAQSLAARVSWSSVPAQGFKSKLALSVSRAVAADHRRQAVRPWIAVRLPASQTSARSRTSRIKAPFDSSVHALFCCDGLACSGSSERTPGVRSLRQSARGGWSVVAPEDVREASGRQPPQRLLRRRRVAKTTQAGPTGSPWSGRRARAGAPEPRQTARPPAAAHAEGRERAHGGHVAIPRRQRAAIHASTTDRSSSRPQTHSTGARARGRALADRGSGRRSGGSRPRGRAGRETRQPPRAKWAGGWRNPR